MPYAVVIPSDARKKLALDMKRAASLVPDLYAVDADYALSELCKDEQKLEKVLLSREFHVSLGRPVAVQVHQIDSFVAMLRQRFQSQQRLVNSHVEGVRCFIDYSVPMFQIILPSSHWLCPKSKIF